MNIGKVVVCTICGSLLILNVVHVCKPDNAIKFKPSYVPQLFNVLTTTATATAFVEYPKGSYPLHEVYIHKISNPILPATVENGMLQKGNPFLKDKP